MDAAQNIGEKAITKSVNFKIGGIDFNPSYIQAVLIVFLIFILLLTLARLRRMYVRWSLKGLFPSIFFGFIIVLVLEAFLFIGGKTLLTEILGWESAPRPISNVIDIGRAKLVKVLGTTDEVSASQSKDDDLDTLVKIYQTLPTSDADEFRSIICEP
jgi:hypothetical protein